MIKKLNLPFLLLLVSGSLIAQEPAGYYNAAENKTNNALKTALYSITSANYVTKSYDYLYTIYKTSDKTAEGNVWDMYSTCTWSFGAGTCGSYSTVCDCYNREHSIPQSWFNSASPMVSDAFHVYPTDGKVNGQRRNFPFGECTSGVTLTSKALGKLGNSTFPGYIGTVFEPVDAYKGDFARTYFYFATRYENKMTTIDGESFNQTTYPSLSAWSVNLFLKWHRQDPVSQKEIDRNNAVYAHQKNRNPFIDHPEIAEYIWGNKMGSPWNLKSDINDIVVEYSISPNPASSVLKIDTNEDNLQYVIYNINGQTVIQGNLNTDRVIDVNELQNGMYIIRLNTAGKYGVKRFIVKK